MNTFTNVVWNRITRRNGAIAVLLALCAGQAAAAPARPASPPAASGILVNVSTETQFAVGDLLDVLEQNHRGGARHLPAY